MTLILVVLAFAAGYGLRAVQPRIRRWVKPPVPQDRNAGLRGYQEYKNG